MHNAAVPSLVRNSWPAYHLRSLGVRVYSRARGLWGFGFRAATGAEDAQSHGALKLQGCGLSATTLVSTFLQSLISWT